MQKSKRIVVVILVVLVGTAAISLCINTEPAYRGKSLSWWMAGFSASAHEDWDSLEFREAAEAIRHIGTNALPHLLKRIDCQTTVSKTEHRLAGWLDVLPESIVPERFKVSSRRERKLLRAQQAVIAFQILGTNAAFAMPQLIRMANDPGDEERASHATRALYEMGPQVIPALLQIVLNTNAPDRYAAMLPLGFLGTNSVEVFPVLIRLLDDPADEVCSGAAEMLGRIRLQPDLCVPALIHCLSSNPNPMARAAAAQSLGRFGSDALPAVSSLRAALSNENNYVQRQAKETLFEIAPEVLTNGIPQ